MVFARPHENTTAPSQHSNLPARFPVHCCSRRIAQTVGISEFHDIDFSHIFGKVLEKWKGLIKQQAQYNHKFTISFSEQAWQAASHSSLSFLFPPLMQPAPFSLELVVDANAHVGSLVLAGWGCGLLAKHGLCRLKMSQFLSLSPTKNHFQRKKKVRFLILPKPYSPQNSTENFLQNAETETGHLNQARSSHLLNRGTMDDDAQLEPVEVFLVSPLKGK